MSECARIHCLALTGMLLGMALVPWPVFPANRAFSMEEREKMRQKASSQECLPIIEAKKAFISYMLEEDLEMTTRDGDSLLKTIYHARPFPSKLQKILSYKFTLTIPPKPAGWDQFLEVMKTTSTMEFTCTQVGSFADVYAWEEGKDSIFGGIVEKWLNRMDVLDRTGKARSTARFSSFEDAQRALDPVANEDMFSGLTLIQNPMALKGKVIMIQMRITQVLGGGKFLLTTLPTGYPEMDGKVYYGYIPQTYTGSREFVDDQMVAVVAEITGTHQYTTVLKANKTIPAMKIYGIRSQG
jgi:hypothetical protein